MKDMQLSIEDMIEDANIAKIRDELVNKISKYNKEELLNWLIATSVLPGNEIFMHRFLILKLLTIQGKPKNKTKEINQKTVETLFEVTKKISWAQFEDYIPIKNSKENYFSFDNIEYHYLAGDLEIPENTLKRIAKFFFPFEDLILKNKKYSIKKNLKKILAFQTRIIDLIGSENLKENKEKLEILLPTENFVAKFTKILKKETDLKEIWPSIKRSHSDSIKDVRQAFTKNPLNDKLILSPYFLIVSFYNKIIDDLTSLKSKKLLDKLNSLTERNILFSLSTIIPLQAILPLFKFEGLDHVVDFGFIADNKLFMFHCIQEKFSDEEFEKDLNSVKLILPKINEKVRSNSKIILDDESIDLVGEIEPVNLIVMNNLSDHRSFMITGIGKKDPIILVNNDDLEHIMLDLRDKQEDLLYLYKIMQCYNKYGGIRSMSFCDFYDYLTDSQIEKKAYTIGDPRIFTFIDPHFSSEVQREKFKSTRPAIDISPNFVKEHFAFHIEKSGDYTYFGQNNLLRLNFYYISKPFKTFIIIDEELYDNYDSRQMSEFVRQFLGYYIEKIFGKYDFDIDTEITITPIEIKKAKEKGIIDDEVDKIGFIKSDNKYIFLYDVEHFSHDFQVSPDNLLKYLMSTLFKAKLGKETWSKIEKDISNIEVKKEFGLKKTVSISNLYQKALFYPTTLDIADVEIMITRKFMNTIKVGVYRSTQAQKTLLKLYEFLAKKIKKELSKYGYEDLAKYFYQQVESGQKERKISRFSYISSKGLKLRYDRYEKYIEEINKIEIHSITSRFLLEQTCSWSEEGKKQINVTDIQKIYALAYKLLNISNLVTFIRDCGDYMDIKLNIENDLGFKFDIKVENSPRESYLKDYTREVETAYHPEFKDDMIEAPSDISPVEMRKEFSELTKKMKKETYLQSINDEIEKHFGFSYMEFLLCMANISRITKWEESDIGIIEIEKSKLLTQLIDETKIEAEKTEKILNFITLFHKGKSKEKIKPWRVHSRENRLTIKPLVQVKDKLIFGLEALALAQDIIMKTINNGQWPYPKGKLSEDLHSALNKRQKHISKRFEKDAEEILKKHSNIVEVNLREKENDKCLAKIEEECPGEIDAISIHKGSKKIMVWEFKDMSKRFGSEEVTADIKEFLDPKKGYFLKHDKKMEFIKKHAKEILFHYKIENSKKWLVDGYVCISGSNLLKNILESKHKIITFQELKEKFDSLIA